MSEFARAQAQAAEATPSERPQAKGLWFGWWVALCLVVLAYNTYRQLDLQRNILRTSGELQAKVGEAARVSGETNLQLGKVAELDRATAQLAVKLDKVSQVNAGLKGQLAGLESTVEGIHQSVVTLDAQALQSRDLLAEIARQSDQLHATLRHSHTVSSEVAVHLEKLVELQDAINADLSEMNVKTKPLERFVGGEP